MATTFIKKMVQRCIRLSIRKENGIIVSYYLQLYYPIWQMGFPFFGAKSVIRDNWRFSFCCAFNIWLKAVNPHGFQANGFGDMIGTNLIRIRKGHPSHFEIEILLNDKVLEWVDNPWSQENESARFNYSVATP